MSSLVLPAPAFEDNTLAGKPAAVEEPKTSEDLKKGLIYPPFEIRALIDKTSQALNKSANPTQLESKIREGQKADPKFSFLNSSDPYHQYYQYALARLREGFTDGAGEGPDGAAAGNAGANGGPAIGMIEGTGAYAGATRQTIEDIPKEPRSLEFLLDGSSTVPGIDLDILKLTALFTARRGGAQFLSSLSQKEGRNYQFDFLRPTHSLHHLFNATVQQYTKVLNPPSDLLANLKISTSDKAVGRKESLDSALERKTYNAWKSKTLQSHQKKKEEQRKLFEEIDWQDFVLVETIDFTQEDLLTVDEGGIELPAPTSKKELEGMTLAQKRMNSMIMEEEPVEEEEEAPEMEVEETTAPITNGTAGRAPAAPAKGMKIKKDYVPKSRQTNVASQTTLCSYCGQQIPNDEISEHIRIELLDPRWKERKALLDSRKTQSSMLSQGTDVTSSLREFASRRTDMFGDDEDEAARKEREEREKKERKEREKAVWDGHTASKQNTQDRFNTMGGTLDEQIAAIHKSIGLGPAPENAAGPQAGPMPQPVPQPPVPAPTRTSAGGVITAAPTGPSAMSSPYSAYPQPSYPQGAYTSGPMPPSAAYSAQPPQQMGAPPSIHPSRLAAMSGPPPSESTLGVRPREDEDGSDPKRQKTSSGLPKLPAGDYYPEELWISSHPEPITLSIQLPDTPDRPELDGSVIKLPPVSLIQTIGMLREKIKDVTNTAVSMSKMRIELPGGKVLTNAVTLASLNLDDGDVLNLGVKK